MLNPTPISTLVEPFCRRYVEHLVDQVRAGQVATTQALGMLECALLTADADALAEVISCRDTAALLREGACDPATIDHELDGDDVAEILARGFDEQSAAAVEKLAARRALTPVTL